jgi:hypothetical protein
MGRLVAVCIRATSSGEGVSVVISQAAPTLCIQVPMLDATRAIQIERKTARWSGLQIEAPCSGWEPGLAASLCLFIYVLPRSTQRRLIGHSSSLSVMATYYIRVSYRPFVIVAQPAENRESAKSLLSAARV